jgi:hypothetical protein
MKKGLEPLSLPFFPGTHGNLMYFDGILHLSSTFLMAQISKIKKKCGNLSNSWVWTLSGS